jgi:hypothetical protein
VINIVNAQGKCSTGLSGEMMRDMRRIDMSTMQIATGAWRKSGVKRRHCWPLSGCFACVVSIALQHFRQYRWRSFAIDALHFGCFSAIESKLLCNCVNLAF